MYRLFLIGTIFNLMTMGEGFTSLGSLIYPSVNYKNIIENLDKCKTVEEKAKVILSEGLNEAALIGIVSNSDHRDHLIMQYIMANNAVLNHEDNQNTAGRRLGIGLQPQMNYAGIAQALVANSETLTPNDLKQAKRTVKRTVKCGAQLYIPFQTNEKSKHKYGHIDLYLEPFDKSPIWWISSFANPMSSNNKIIEQCMQENGFTHITPSPPKTTVEKLFSNINPKKLNSWNIVMTGDLSDKGQSLTFSELMKTQNDDSKFIYNTKTIIRVKLSLEEYQEICIIRELENISKRKSKAYPLSLGVHSGVHSCVHFASGILKANMVRECYNMADFYEKITEQANACWVTIGEDRRPWDFFKNDKQGFLKINSETLSAELKNDYYRQIFKEPITYASHSNAPVYWNGYKSLSKQDSNQMASLFFKKVALLGLKILKKDEYHPPKHLVTKKIKFVYNNTLCFET